MILAVDVTYDDQTAFVAGVVFDKWDDKRSSVTITSTVSGFSEYVPGEFYRRELPCILTLLKEHRIRPACILVDGFVYLDGVSKPGLGKYLYNALRGKIAVIGVAKKPFKDISEDFAVYRGKSTKPLYVTSIGLETVTAKRCVAAMSGLFRVPDLLKSVDQVCRSLAVAASNSI